ncbi:chymotrypsin-2 [Nasonia vitripennis]|uniref:Peptidase S1 domain-containing protein n=1 Tax=Nasonia vitripennis TaxID=7425 RepID=A0A7M7QFK1_NASVI|nr:chymotrypsin-2 [Nasonia vitripennis]
MTVVTGTNSLKSGGKSYKVDSLSYYEKYVDKTEDPDFMYDIGVITLAKEVELSKLVEIIPLPTKDVKGGEDAVITGWGTMKTPDSPLSQTLNKLNVQVVNNARCQLYYLGARTIQKSHICAFRKRGTGTCSGDSGGPLVSDGEIIGVVSGGVACAKGFPDIYTRIYYYLDYVKEIIGDKSTKQ